VCNQAVFREDVIIISNNCKNEKKKGKPITSNVAEFIIISAMMGSHRVTQQRTPSKSKLERLCSVTCFAELLGNLHQIGSANHAHSHMLLPK
jgi:hypothetical protein